MKDKVRMYIFSEGVCIAEVKAISAQVIREMAGIYTTDSPTKPKVFSRGKRGITGSLVFYDFIPRISDEPMPPVDVCIIQEDWRDGVELFGHVFNVEFLNEGWGVTWNELEKEKQYTYLSTRLHMKHLFGDEEEMGFTLKRTEEPTETTYKLGEDLNDE